MLTLLGVCGEIALFGLAIFLLKVHLSSRF